MHHSPGFLRLVNDAKSRVMQTNVEDVKKRLDNAEQFILIDVREESEWHRDHIPNAIHVSKGIIERDIERIIPDNSTEIILYCGGGFRSALTADNLRKMGYSNVSSMDGGYRGWKAAGFPLVGGASIKN